jgi:pyruvate carboxylase
LGLTENWPQIKHLYAEAKKVLGDIPKVTPSSKVVGDLAQFMVSQNLDAVAVVERADKLAFPESTVGYLRGEIGIPPGGFTEPLRSKVLESHGLTAVLGRPGAELEDYDFEKAEVQLHKNMLALHINMCAVVPFIPRYLKVGTNIKLFMGLCQIWTRICSCIHSRREKKRSWKLVPAKRLSLNSCPKKMPTRRDHAQRRSK